jgi:CysZ protein
VNQEVRDPAIEAVLPGAGPMERVPARSQEPPPLRIADGAGAFFRGIGFVVSTPRVWPYAWVPVLLLMTLTSVLAALGLWGSWHLISAIVSGASAWAEAGRWLLEVLIGGVVLVVALLLGFAFAQPLSGFALEAISEHQSVALGGPKLPKPSFRENFFRSLAVNLLGLAVGLPLFAILTTIELFAPPAAVVTFPLKFVVSALLLAWDLLDYPLGLRRVDVPARLAFFRRNFWGLFVFGAFGAIVLLVPGLGLLLLPFGVAGATRLVIKARA